MCDYKDILFQLSASFINLSLDQLDAAIDAALASMGQFVDADRAYVFWHDLEAGTTSNTHEWCGPGISPQIDSLQSVPLESVPEWTEPHSQGQVINVPDVAALPESSLRDLLVSQDILSLISLPMIGKKGYQGFVGFDSVRQPHFYSDEEVRLLGLFANLLVSVEERRQAEQAIIESEERLRLALEAANQGLFDLDLVTGRVIVSPEYARMLGHDPDSFQETRSAWLARIHPDDQAMVLGILEDYLQGRTPGIRVEFRQLTAAGEWKWVLCLARIKQWSADGRPLRLLGTQTDITELRRASEQIQHLLYHDPVTGLPNRSLMLDRLRRNLARIDRYRHRAGLMVLGLDHFKDFNATQGHAAGDRLLCDLASRLQACVGPADTVARLGGDEFVIIIDEVADEAGSPSGMEALALRVLEALREPFEFQTPEGKTSRRRVHHVDASVGVVVYEDQGLSAEELLKRAETAMYEAKAAGGNTLRFFAPGMQSRMTDRIALLRDLRQALDKEQMLVLYQPQVDDAGRIVGAEMLLRWNHPSRGFIPPPEFIGLAEETGLILPIGEWVLDQAFSRLADWAARPRLATLDLAVNVSARQFGSPGLVPQLLSQARAHAAPLTRLKLELTESLLLKEIDQSIARMRELRGHGIGIALDDFGTGHSSLSYLKRLPITQIKIDQSFVREMPTNPVDAAIIGAITLLSRTLGIPVIAEGVETEPQRDALRELGCDLYQGYLYGKALTIEEFESRVLAPCDTLSGP